MGGAPSMTGPRTFWHLAALGHKPRDYDIASTNLLYYPARGFEIAAPLADWYRVHQRERELVCDDWDAFRDPRETTYTRYTELQRDKEVVVDALLASSDDAQLRSLPAAWIGLLDRVMGPLRHPVHGLQMVASYVGAMAPSGRIAIACLFQAADERRRVERLAQRTWQLQRAHAGFAERSREAWQRDPLWQPLRETIERLLVAYDWDEALVALCGVVKPAFDDLFDRRLGELARAHADETLQRMLASLGEDAAWHRAWVGALFDRLAAGAKNVAAIARWRASWNERIQAALRPFDELFSAAEDNPR
jgi:toluene monooxygenase system protein E